MRKFLLLFFVSLVTLFGCGKESETPKPSEKVEEEYKLSDITYDRDVVGVYQTVVCKVEKPSWVGNVVTYKWEFTNPNGVKGVITTDVNQAILHPLVVGKYKVEVFVSSKGIEARSDGEINAVDCDFGVGIFGDSKQIILDAKEFDSKYPESGLSSGFYWPFSSDRPTESVSFKTGNRYEKYIFKNDKFVAGNIEIINEPFRTTPGGADRNLSYFKFLEFVDYGNRIFSVSTEPTVHWRNGVSEEQKKRYETMGSTKNDGIGWALMNRDITEVTIGWSNSAMEGKAYIKAMGNNSLYEAKISIRKK